MASSVTPPVPGATTSVTPSCACGQGLAYLVLRVGLGLMLMLYGVEKFKSPAMPYNYKFSYWHDTLNEEGVVVATGNWVKVAKPVFEFGGFNNTDFYGEKTVNFFSYIFKYYAQGLPYAMIGVGIFILLGILNRLSLFLGASIWLSLALGQMTLPDSPTVALLMNFTLYYVVALALVRYNRFGLMRY